MNAALFENENNNSAEYLMWAWSTTSQQDLFFCSKICFITFDFMSGNNMQDYRNSLSISQFMSI